MPVVPRKRHPHHRLAGFIHQAQAARALHLEEEARHRIVDPRQFQAHAVERAAAVRAVAGAGGEAVSLVCVDEHKLLADIERTIRQKIERVIVPGFEPDPNAKPEPLRKPQQARPPRRDSAPRGAAGGKPAGNKPAGAGRPAGQRPNGPRPAGGNSNGNTGGGNRRPPRAGL